MRIIRNAPAHSPGPAEHFNGSVRIDEIAAPEPPSRPRLFSVHFAPRGHTGRHAHPHGQALHVTGGEGPVQRRGGPVEAIRAGGTVWIEPGEWHWHGAAPRTFMTHLALVEAAAHGSTIHWHTDPGVPDHLAARGS